MSPELSFPASYDTTTKIISVVVCILLAGVTLFTHSVVVAGAGAVLLLLSYAYSPRGYVVADRCVTVRRLLRNVFFPLDGILEARRARADDFRGVLRLWGVGGLFGYYGLFRTSTLGKCWWYLTNRRNAVVVVTEKETALFSPDDVSGFLAAVGSAVLVPEIPPARRVGAIDSQSGGNRIASVIGAGIAVLVLAIIAFAFLYSPGPPSYTLTGTSLTIHDRFYPLTVDAATVEVNQIRVVDISGDSGWRPTARTNGFANAHYHSGWFRVANGRRVRMYWADGHRLVLLPPKGQGNAVLLEVSGPEQFVAEVRMEWSKGS